MHAIAFDFDGVIVDSEEAKETAWLSLFKKEPKVSPILTEGIKRYGGGKGSRYDILRYIFTQFEKPRNKIEELVLEYADRYNEIVQHSIHDMGVIPDSLEAISYLSKKYPLYLNSATPEEALIQSAKNLRIQHYFTGILGRPSTKVENLLKVIDQEYVNIKELLFVGDGEDDYAAALKIGCNFVGIRSNLNTWDGTSFPVISTLRDLDKMVKEWYI